MLPQLMLSPLRRQSRGQTLQTSTSARCPTPPSATRWADGVDWLAHELAAACCLLCLLGWQRASPVTCMAPGQMQLWVLPDCVLVMPSASLSGTGSSDKPADLPASSALQARCSSGLGIQRGFLHLVLCAGHAAGRGSGRLLQGPEESPDGDSLCRVPPALLHQHHPQVAPCPAHARPWAQRCVLAERLLLWLLLSINSSIIGRTSRILQHCTVSISMSFNSMHKHVRMM